MRETKTTILIHASKDQRQTGGKVALKFNPRLKRTPTLLSPLGIDHSTPNMGSLYNQNQSVTRYIDPFFETRGATLG